jgi:hypothetical protein
MPMPRRARWSWYANLVLALWLISAPATHSYTSRALAWSDVTTGALVLVLGVLAIRNDRPWRRWGICFAGIWLLFAPLAFWAPRAVAYSNDTLIGALLIALSVLVPGMPGMTMFEGPTTPPGWSYNPSSWIQRGPIIALGIIAFFISRYMAAYQLGHTHAAWDPFFDTQRVLTSDVSRAWPISDAGFGALAYLLEALSGFMGGEERWRSMPWMVAMFGVLVIPLGMVSIILVILQPVMVGSWCTLCLVTAALMLVMIPLAVDEVAAMLQFLRRAVREGQPLWRTFWIGGTLHADARRDPSSQAGGDAGPRASDDRGQAARRRGAIARLKEMTRGVTTPWNLLLCVMLGVWLMAAPGVLGVTGALATSSHIVGAAAVTVAAVALAEVTRLARLLDVPLGLWIAVAPWVLGAGMPAARWNGAITGVLIALLAIRRGAVRERSHIEAH